MLDVGPTQSWQGICVKGVCWWTAVVLAIATTTSALVLSSAPARDAERPDVLTHSLAVGDPVAVIAPLPDYVSNGSWYDLDARDSYDTDGGIIKDWFWEIELGSKLETSHAALHRYMFRDLGLYKITLTVTDSMNQTNRSFTAVVSVLDTDGDNMPDWWELQYFDDLNQTDDGDYDGDSYGNLEEYAKGTDPSVKDAQPGFLDEMASHWYVFVIVAAIIVSIGLSIWPLLRKKRQVHEKQKIEAAIAIEKELDRDEQE